jgi:hypothetical protein
MTDTILRKHGINILLENLGTVETERFIALLLREPFDYTEWRKDLFVDLTVEEISQKAMEHYNNTNSEQ